MLENTIAIIKRWAKAEVAVLAPLVSELAFDSLTRLGEAGAGNTIVTVVAYGLLVWLTPNAD